MQTELKQYVHVGHTREPIAESTRRRGKVVWFSDEKGFGYIRPEHGCLCECHTVEGMRGAYAGPCVYCQTTHSPDLFVHFSAIDADPAKRRKLLPQQIVEYEPAESHKGPYAAWVKVVSA